MKAENFQNMLCLTNEVYLEHYLGISLTIGCYNFVPNAGNAEGKDWNNIDVTLVCSHVQFKIRRRCCKTLSGLHAWMVSSL